jgi:hypothetical protein
MTSAVEAPTRGLARLLVSQLVGLAVVGVLLAALGARAALVLLVVAFLLIGQATALSSRFRRALLAFTHVVEHVVGRALAVVLLVPLYVLVITPVVLLLRVFGVDALRARRQAGWTARAAVRTLPSRTYAHDRPQTPGADRRGGRRVLVVRTVAAVLVVQLLVVGSVVAFRDRLDPEPQLGGASSFGAARSAALAGQDWVPQALDEAGQVGSQGAYEPYTGFALADFEGEHVNVQDRVRRSYEPDVPPGREPIDVWFFGGSAMFGFDLQRDLHTIPSEVVRLAEQDGIYVQARNYGAPGFVNFQESVLLAELVTGGQQPELAVFYDGINDASLQMLNRLSGFDAPGEPSQLSSQTVRGAFADVAMVSAEAPPGVLPADDPGGFTTVDAIVDDVADVYGQGIGLSQALAAQGGFEVAHFWQPDIYARSPLDPGEEALLDGLALDPPRRAAMVALAEHIRAGLPDGVVDLSTALDDVQGPVFGDSVHVNELGAAAIAEDLYASIRPQLEAIASG